MYTQSDITTEVAKQLIAEHGGVEKAAQAIASECCNAFGGKPQWRTIRQWIQHARDGKVSERVTRTGKAQSLERLAALIERSGFSVDDVGKVHRIRLGSHKGFIKNSDDKIEYTEPLSADSIVFSPAWEDGPEYPLVQYAKPTTIKYAKYRPAPRIGRTLVIIPDTQIGFLRPLDNFSELVPMHDLQAIDVALQIVADIQPDQLGYVGDILDLTEMSRWPQQEEFLRTTQSAINEAHRILAQFEAAAGAPERRQKTFAIMGNHDRRIRDYLLKGARAAFHLRPAQQTPESWPDLSVPHLLRFEELGIEYCGEYPGSEYWITPQLVVRHNPEGKDAYDASVIAGHSHRVNRTTYSRRTPDGPKHHSLWEIGCLCRIDEYADPRSLMRTSVPSDRGFVKNWTQAICIVHVDDDGQFAVETVEIHNGKALYAGRVYRAEKVAVASAA